MHLVNTRILRPIWRKSVKRQKKLYVFLWVKHKNRMFLDFTAPRPKIKIRASSGHASLQYTNFEGSLKKIGWEKVHAKQWKVVLAASSASNVNTFIIYPGSVRLTASFPISYIANFGNTRIIHNYTRIFPFFSLFF